MQIKKTSPADVNTVLRITQDTIRAVYPHYYPAGAVEYFLHHHHTEAIRSDIADNCVYLCISYAGEPIGTVTVRENDIGRLFVLPEYQGLGCGRLLLDYAEQIIAQHYPAAKLDVSFAAKAIYLKRGYQATGWHVIAAGNGDFLCFDEMEKHF